MFVFFFPLPASVAGGECRLRSDALAYPTEHTLGLFYHMIHPHAADHTSTVVLHIRVQAIPKVDCRTFQRAMRLPTHFLVSCRLD